MILEIFLNVFLRVFKTETEQIITFEFVVFSRVFDVLDHFNLLSDNATIMEPKRGKDFYC